MTCDANLLLARIAGPFHNKTCQRGRHHRAEMAGHGQQMKRLQERGCAVHME